MPEYVVLCERQLEKLTPDKASAPEADPHAVVAADAIGPFEDISDAEHAIITAKCEARHFILRVNRWRKLSL